MEITGLVLCGGLSTRMGTDKGSILKDGKPWARIIYEKMSALNIPCKLSINKDQLKDYSCLFSPQELILDQLNIPGPLRGILSAHLQFPENNWLIMACDMIDMDEVTLRNILKAETEVPDNDFYVYKNEKHYEPFGGIYTAAGLQQVLNLYRIETLNDFSLQHILRTFKTHTLFSADNTAPFRNYNN